MSQFIRSTNYWQRSLQSIKSMPLAQKCLLLLTLSLPFDRVPSYEIASFNVRFSSIFAILCISLAFKRVVNDTSLLRRARPLFIGALWVAWLCFSLVWAHDLTSGLKIVIPLIFLLVTSGAVAILWRPKYMRSIFIALVIGMVFSASFGVFQFIANFLGVSNAVTLIRPEYSWQGFGFPRIHSFSLEPLYLACYFLLPLALAIAYSVKNKLKVHMLLLGSIILGSSIVVLTLSRGGIAGLLVVFLTLLFAYRKTIKNLITKRLVLQVSVSFFISLGLIIGMITLFNRPGNDSDLTYNQRGIGTFVSHLSNTRFFANKDNKDKDDSIGQRDTARSQTLEVISSDPKILLVGLGAGQYETYASERFGTRYIGDANNLIIEQLVQGGVIGLGLLLLFYGAMIRRLYRYSGDKKWVSLALTSYLLAVFMQAQTFHGLSLTHLWFAFGIAAALTMSGKKINNRLTTRNVENSL